MASVKFGKPLAFGSFGFTVMHCSIVQSNGQRRHLVWKQTSHVDDTERDVVLSLRHPLLLACDVPLSLETGGLITDLQEQGNLTSFLRSLKRPFSNGELWFVFEQLLEAVAYIHDQGVVHADLKPDNVLLSSRGQLQVTDFGSAVVSLPLGKKGTYECEGHNCSHMPPEAQPGAVFWHALDFFR